MTRPVLIDTSAWVEAMRRRGDETIRNEVHAALRTGRARFCDFVRLELWNGVGGDAERKWLLELEQKCRDCSWTFYSEGPTPGRAVAANRSCAP